MIKKISILLVMLLSCNWTRVGATYNSKEDVEELSYSELVDRLSKKKTYFSQGFTSPFDDVTIHAGIGYVNSFSQFIIGDRAQSRYQNGMQLSLGVDLFSKKWFSEAVFRNYGLTTSNTEDLILRELQLKFGYKDQFHDQWNFRFQSGLSHRFLTIRDPGNSVNISEQSPSLMMSSGVYLQANPNVSIGFDLGGRTAVLSKTADKNSFDFTFDVKASL